MFQVKIGNSDLKKQQNLSRISLSPEASIKSVVSCLHRESEAQLPQILTSAFASLGLSIPLASPGPGQGTDPAKC